MAKKKRAQRGTKRKVSKKVAFKGADLKKKITIVLNNLLFSVALFLVSLVLFRFLQNEILVNIFQGMSLIFGSVAVAFLIVLAVLFILKIAKKK